MKNLLKILTLASILVAPMSYAATISSLNDGFETEASTSTLNYNSFANWDVTAGTVDLIKNGNSWGITSSEGDYSVDLDGSTGNAGVLT
ncbi:MAG TPA: PEP-CTERM sorting domain-containing protein, partial [Methylophaga aminisulfidivorans]|nr:PEP-CTERM sorting domain-containing protein [Methylophaga aminisulfidivorans]